MKVLVVCKDEGSKDDESCRMIKEEGFEVVYAWKNTLSKKELEGVDFVISIGGDGTALSASHYLEDKPLLAVNSRPGKSEGVLTIISIGDLNQKLKEIKKKGFELEELDFHNRVYEGYMIELKKINHVKINTNSLPSETDVNQTIERVCVEVLGVVVRHLGLKL